LLQQELVWLIFQSFILQHRACMRVSMLSSAPCTSIYFALCHCCRLFCCFAAGWGVYDYGAPDYMPFWPSSMSGICLAAIINLAMVVLTFLQPTSPAHPITQVKKGELPRQTLNNARGYFFPHGDLKHLPALDDPDSRPIPSSGLARIINTAISAAGFLGKCWTDVRAAGAVSYLVWLCMMPVACIQSSRQQPCTWEGCQTV
jgi:hypothetical protein